MGKKKKKYHQIQEKKTPEPVAAAVGKFNNSRRINLAVLSILLIFSFIVYGNSLKNPFIWDDQYLVIENHFVKSLKYVPEIFTNHLYYTTAGLSNFYRPLQTLFLMLDFSFWKENVIGYHLANICVHIGNAFLVYLLLCALFRRRIIAFFVSLLFLVHPVNSTVVDYISSRADSQVMFFVVLSVLLFVKSSDNKKLWIYLVSLFSFMLALLSKELGIILPFLILITIPAVLSYKIEDEEDTFKTRKLLFLKTIPYFLILVTYILLRLTVLNFMVASKVRPAGLGTRLLTTCEAFVQLIKLLFYPVGIHIEKNIPFSSGFTQPSTFFSIMILIGILFFMLLIRKRNYMCFFGLSWFFVALIPMANIMPINATLADHWVYLPCFGFFLAVIGFIVYLYDRIKESLKATFRRIFIFLFIIVITILSVMTIRQNTIWSSPLRFYQLALKNSPDSFRAHNEIGVIYMNEDRFDLAIEEFKKAININPGFDQAYDNLGIAYDKSGDYVNAIIQHKKAIELNSNNPKVYNNMGNAYIKMQQFERAIEVYKIALMLNPDYKAAYNNLGVVYYKQGKYDDARYYWERALSIDPDFEIVIKNLMVLNQMQGK